LKCIFLPVEIQSGMFLRTNKGFLLKALGILLVFIGNPPNPELLFDFDLRIHAVISAGVYFEIISLISTVLHGAGGLSGADGLFARLD
jgi:hypothetical protein